MEKFDTSFLDNLTKKAKTNHRKRQNYNVHKHFSDTLQRMFNAMEPDTYVRPHKHEQPDKRELFTIVRGKAIVIEFDDFGLVVDYALLSYPDNMCAVEISPRTWHTIIALEEGTIVFEVKDGPYDPADDKDFAPWSPNEYTNEAKEYNSNLLNRFFKTI